MKMNSTCVILLVILWEVMFAVGFSHGLKSTTDTDAKIRAQQALGGFFDYYWKNDTSNSNIKFFFVCGQIGEGIGDECTCQDPSSCVSCYRWWSAVALESVATYGIYMNTTNHSGVADMTFDHSPYNSNWQPENAFIDDFLWYGIAYLRVYEWLNESKWLDRSVDLYDWIWKYGWQEPCGGIIWCYDDTRSFKDNIQLVQAMHLSAKLAYIFPNKARFLDNAKKIWNWFFSFNDGRGIVTDQNILATGLVPERCCNATSDSLTRCHNSNINGTAYNQGIFLSAAAYLYLTTANKSYIETAFRVFKAVAANYTVGGVLRDEPRSYQSYKYDKCISGSDPGGDWYSFNGIFMLHLGYFVDVLSKNGSLPPDILKDINDLVQKTSDSAWTMSTSWPPFDSSSNGCSPSLDPANKEVTYPKFHWWWWGNVKQQQIPPDPRYYFHKFDVRCVSIGKDTQIWAGKIGSELKCTQKCNTFDNCSKYLYSLYSVSAPDFDCWLWSYNHSDHTCNQIAQDWNIGIRRPIGNASCVGECGSKEPQSLDQGVCFCDEECPKHLDCCIDYAQTCHPDVQISCKGNCDEAIAQPIPGGGYCWCDLSCNPSFTDNNSDGSCCADYPQECLAIEMPACLDARSQGSALNLFLGHISISNAMNNNRCC